MSNQVELLVRWDYCGGTLPIRTEGVVEIEHHDSYAPFMGRINHQELDFTRDLLFFPHPISQEIWTDGWERARCTMHGHRELKTVKIHKLLEILSFTHDNALLTLLRLAGSVVAYQMQDGAWSEYRYGEGALWLLAHSAASRRSGGYPQ